MSEDLTIKDLRPMAEAPETAAWIVLWYVDGINLYPIAAHYACGDGDGLMPRFDGWFKWSGGRGSGFIPAPTGPAGWTPISAPDL